MYRRGSAITIPLILIDGQGEAIKTGDVQTDISRDATPWKVTQYNAVPLSGELWRLFLTVTETECEVYVVRVKHKELAGPLYYMDRALPETKLEPTPVQVTLAVNGAAKCL